MKFGSRTRVFPHSPRSLPERGTRVFHLRLWLFLTALFFLLTITFPLLTPVHGGPDEQQHLIYGYGVVTGQVPVSETVLAPEFLGQSSKSCWQREFLPATCQQPMDSHATDLVPLPTTAANYPPLYYALSHWPLLFLSGTPAIWAIRFFSAGLFAMLCALGVTALACGTKQRSHCFAVCALSLPVLTPAFFQVGGYANPQVLELGAMLWLAGLLIPLTRLSPGRADRSAKRIFPRTTVTTRLLLATLAAALVTLSRPTGPVWPIIFCLVLAVACGFRRCLGYIRLRAMWVFIAVNICASLLWLAWNAISSTTRPLHSFVRVITPQEWARDLLEKREFYLTDTIGAVRWTLYENGNPIRAYALFLVLLLILALLVHRFRTSLALVCGALSIPAIALASSIAVSGRAGFEFWQARYGFPMVFAMLMLASYTVCVSLRRMRVLPWVLAFSGGIVFASTAVEYFIQLIGRYWRGGISLIISRDDLNEALALAPPSVTYSLYLGYAAITLLCCTQVGCIILSYRASHISRKDAATHSPLGDHSENPGRHRSTLDTTAVRDHDSLASSNVPDSCDSPQPRKG
ncbi:hypothetical protein ACRQHG_00625 [Actinotignum sp. GS-2025a]|uniref:hypothetical protein n=1 Tax=Actinotignum sp. GS-2025a TaxID=3427274 RepID=UPI003F467B1F